MLLLPAIAHLLDDREPAGVRGAGLLEDPALNPVPFAWVDQPPAPSCTCRLNGGAFGAGITPPNNPSCSSMT
jgi:hypothetical protein